MHFRVHVFRYVTWPLWMAWKLELANEYCKRTLNAVSYIHALWDFQKHYGKYREPQDKVLLQLLSVHFITSFFRIIHILFYRPFAHLSQALCELSWTSCSANNDTYFQLIWFRLNFIKKPTLWLQTAPRWLNHKLMMQIYRLLYNLDISCTDLSFIKWGTFFSTTHSNCQFPACAAGNREEMNNGYLLAIKDNNIHQPWLHLMAKSWTTACIYKQSATREMIILTFRCRWTFSVLWESSSLLWK